MNSVRSFAIIGVLSTICFYVAHWALAGIGTDGSREEREETEVLRIIAGMSADSNRLDFDGFLAAVGRLLRSGAIVRGPCCFFLTSRGWARVGRPLSGYQISALRWLHSDTRWRSIVLSSDLETLRTMGLVRGYVVTAAGRAVLEDPHAPA